MMAIRKGSVLYGGAASAGSSGSARLLASARSITCRCHGLSQLGGGKAVVRRFCLTTAETGSRPTASPVCCVIRLGKTNWEQEKASLEDLPSRLRMRRGIACLLAPMLPLRAISQS